VFPERILERFPELDAGQVALLEAHWELLKAWNRKINLTTITDLETAVERHYGESLILGRHLPAGHWSVVDIGSGPGFPGFPVAVLRADCQVTLIESHQRKAVFLREASRKIPNVRVLAKRAEDVAERFDWAISRAVSYEDLQGSLGRLAGRAMLLTGAEPPPGSLGFTWGAPVALPGAEGRFLCIAESEVA